MPLLDLFRLMGRRDYHRATLNEFAGLIFFAGGLPGGPLVILLVELVIVNFLHFCSKLLKNKYVQ